MVHPDVLQRLLVSSVLGILGLLGEEGVNVVEGIGGSSKAAASKPGSAPPTLAAGPMTGGAVGKGRPPALGIGPSSATSVVAGNKGHDDGGRWRSSATSAGHQLDDGRLLLRVGVVALGTRERHKDTSLDPGSRLLHVEGRCVDQT